MYPGTESIGLHPCIEADGGLHHGIGDCSVCVFGCDGGGSELALHNDAAQNMKYG